MRVLRCAHAEWLLVRPRLTRSSYGISLLVLGAALLWLRSRGLDPITVSLQAGALSAVIGVGFAAGGEADRAALSVALTHPTTALAMAGGRWLAAMIPAAALTGATTMLAAGSVGSAAAGVLAAAAVGGCALAVAMALGNAGVAALFLFMVIAGGVPPERLIAVAEPGIVRVGVASALELGPALWHYRDAARGATGAILHALAWTALGVLLASALIARRRFR